MTREEFQKRFTYNPDTDRLGEGGFGEVFKTYDTVRDRWVAIKVSKVKPELESVRLRKEVEMVNHLPEHPNVAFYEACYTFREMSGEYDFGILQYYNEGNLNHLLNNNSLSLLQKQSLLSQILDGLEFLHEHGIIHRDLKPQNILIVKRQNGEYVPKITDFGISKQLDINNSSFFSNSLAGAGTLAYASPEQLRGSEIRKNADLWSFGVIAFQVFTGQLPFTTGEHSSTSEAGRTELFRQINSGELPSEINGVPEPWQMLIRKCLVTDPAQRIKNEQEAKDILTGKKNHIIDDETQIEPPVNPLKPISPILPTPPEPTPSPAPNRNRNLLIAIAAAALVLLLFFGWRAIFHNDGSNGNQTEAVTEIPNDILTPADSVAVIPTVSVTDSIAPPPPELDSKVADYLDRGQSAFDNKHYNKAKILYNNALQLIPASNPTNIREVIKSDIAECDKMIKKQEADAKEKDKQSWETKINSIDKNLESKNAFELLPIFFLRESSEVSKSQMPKVVQAAKYLTDNPSAKLTITAYGDKLTGTSNAIVFLTERRAKAVAKILVNQFGISSYRLLIDWKGATVQPFKENDQNNVVIFTKK